MQCNVRLACSTDSVGVLYSLCRDYCGLSPFLSFFSRRALELTYALVNEDNARALVKEMLIYLVSSGGRRAHTAVNRLSAAAGAHSNVVKVI